MSAASSCIPAIVSQHAQESAHLRNVRVRLLGAPDIKLGDLARHDQRVAAHLDGLAVAGEPGWRFCEEGLETPGAGELFVAAVRALEDGNALRLNRLMLLAAEVPGAQRGLTSALGWVSSRYLKGTIRTMLISVEPLQRWMGIVACAMHRVDPGEATRMEEEHPEVRARLLRTAGELGRYELVSALATRVADEDPACRFWAAWSAVLAGDRHNALEALKVTALSGELWQARALQLSLQAMPMADAHAMLRGLALEPAYARRLICGAGLAGDPTYVPWLVARMTDDKSARAAGEAFSMITGVDLAALKLEREPAPIAAAPNDDPEDLDVDMDLDEGLPWPDQALVQAWWTQHGPRFTQGTRHFVGAPITRSHCIDVLKNGYQRQRIAAAYHLCLVNPGTPLFEWRAPAWRQQRELAQMS